MRADLRFAWRTLWRNPSTTLGAMLALALGIGATTTMFGLLDAVALRPLPYPQADRLVELWGTVERDAGPERRGASVPDYLDWKAGTTSFDQMAAWWNDTFIRYGTGAPEQVRGEVVSAGYFELLGVAPVAGRTFAAADDQDGAPPVALIGERLWERAYGRRPDAVGGSIQLDGQVYTIVGVAPAAFRGRSDAAEAWVTMTSNLPPSQLANRGSRWFSAVARLAPGVSLDQARAEISGVAAQLAQAYPATNEKRGVEVSPLSDEVFGQLRPAITLLFAAVAFVLVIACANVASLLLARAESRRRELSLRRAIGADDRALVRLMLAESAWVVLLGAAAGCLLAVWASDPLLALSPVQLPSFAAPGVNWRTLAFVAGLGVTITFAVGLLPLRAAGGASLSTELREGAVESRGGSRSRLLQLIVAGQVAVTVTLLVGASLFARSFSALVRFDPGFEPRGVLTMRVQLPLTPGSPAPADPPPSIAMPLLDDLRALPGVSAAALSTSIPLDGASAIFYSAEGQAAYDATNRPRAYVHRITPGYLDTVGLRLVDGRDFMATDLDGDGMNVLVTQALARRFWPGESAVGHRIRQGGPENNQPWLTIVGVVADANLRGIPRNPTNDPDIFFRFNTTSRAFGVLLRTTGDPAALARAADAVLHRRDAGVAVYAVRPLEDLAAQQLGASRFLSWLTGVFALTALVLAMIGIYGLLSHWVGRRTREIGVRAALGAGRGRLLALVVGQGVGLALAGVAAGAAAAAWLGQFVSAQLYAVRPLDLASFLVTAGVMLLTALAASLMPALRALRVDPVTALRQ